MAVRAGDGGRATAKPAGNQAARTSTAITHRMQRCSMEVSLANQRMQDKRDFQRAQIPVVTPFLKACINNLLRLTLVAV